MHPGLAAQTQKSALSDQHALATLSALLSLFRSLSRALSPSLPPSLGSLGGDGSQGLWCFWVIQVSVLGRQSVFKLKARQLSAR